MMLLKKLDVYKFLKIRYIFKKSDGIGKRYTKNYCVQQ